MATPTSKQDLINMGYEGYQGWGEAEALADYRATGGSGKKTVPATTSVATSVSPTVGMSTQDFSTLMSTIQGRMKALGELPSTLEKTYNVPALTAEATKAGEAVSALPENVISQAKRLGSSEAQRGLMYGREYGKIAPVAQKATELAQTAEKAMSERLSYESSAAKTELDTLLNLYTTGAQLSEQQAKRLQDLAIEEKKIEATKAATEAAQQKGEVTTIGGSKYLVNPYTGAKTYLGPADSTGTSSITIGGTTETKPTTTPTSTFTPLTAKELFTLGATSSNVTKPSWMK